MFKNLGLAIFAMFGLSTLALADYATDMQATFQAETNSLLTDAGLMLTDIIPIVFGIMVLFMLLKLGKKFFSQAK